MKMPPLRRAVNGLLACVCTHALVASPCAAQDPLPAYTLASSEPAAAAKEGKVLHALRLSAGEAPRIDGRLDDEAWARAEAVDGFVQWEPDNMAPMTERTVLQVAYDDRNLYVAITCHDGDADAVEAPLARRDDLRSIPTDVIGIGFDPRHDHLTGYVFMTNPAAVQDDFTFFNDEAVDRDYDAVWEVRTQRTPHGWTVEFRIPFSQVRFDAQPSSRTVWGFSARREIHRKGESGEWTGRPRGERGAVSRWGHLVFEDRLAPPRRVELLPYVSARAETAVGSGAFAGGAGADVRLGVGTQATLSATLNPDFGQVEVDPAVLNLTIFETFFPEKRPFFLEDSRTFVPPYGLFQLFHSRRIGRRPNRFATQTTGTVVQRPDNTSVLGAAKFTGKGAGWTYGILTALTAAEHGVVETTDQDADGTTVVSRAERLLEPMTSYGVARVQRDVMNGTSNLGGIVTAVLRDGDAGAFTGGADYTFRWNRNRDLFNGHWAVTRAPGTTGTQTGFGGVSNLGFSRKHWGTFVHFDHFGRNFRVDDLGFIRTRANSNAANVNVRLEQPDPWGNFRRIGVFTGGGQSWNNDRLVFGRFAFIGTGMQFRNFWSIDASFGRGFRTLDDVDTRGGPPILKPADHGVRLFVNSDSRRTWRLTFEGEYHRDEVGGGGGRFGPTLRLQPLTRLQASVGLSYQRALRIAQWIANEDTTGDGELDYVYGTLRQNVVDVTLRSTFALHRDLVLQVFLQPFVAAGDYSGIRRLARPRSFDFEPSALSYDPDFNRKSLRGNAVLRWEYLRGSTLFVVWNVSTLDERRPGVFSPWRDLADGVTAEGTHVLMVKASYWFSR